MKPAQIIKQYIWIVRTLKEYKRLSLEELSRLWISEKVTEGNPLSRTSFFRHKDAIFDMFGIIIACDQKNGYKYFIENPEALDDDSVGRWMFSTLAVNIALSDSAGIKERILLENVPAGELYLPTIIKAIRQNRRISIGYQRFGAKAYEKIVSPYALKLWHQRWYLLAFTAEDFRTYALDRMTSIIMTNETFEMPKDFMPQKHFEEYYGVLTVNIPMEHVVIRAYNVKPDYLRTLPLHSSQREISCTEEYTEFSLDIRPTEDFIEELLSYGPDIEVLAPTDLRETIRQKLADSLKRY